MRLSDLVRDYTKDSLIGHFRRVDRVHLNLFLLDAATQILNKTASGW